MNKSPVLLSLVPLVLLSAIPGPSPAAASPFPMVTDGAVKRGAVSIILGDDENHDRGKEGKWRKRAMRHAPGLDRDADVIRGDLKIEEGETFRGDLVVRGNLDVLGKIRGDAVAFGDVYLGPDAVVRGDVISIGGEITREDGSEVRGDIVEVWEKAMFGGAIRITAKERDQRPKKGDLEDYFPRRREGKVLFRYWDPSADEVYLVGDFNDWDEDEDPMERTGNVWETAIPLHKGRYDYAFVVDGDWEPDPSNPESVRDRETDLIYSVIHVDGRGRVQSPKRRVKVRVYSDDSEFDLKTRYNRVDGFYLAGILKVEKWDTYSPKFRGRLGYAFARKDWLGEAEIQQPLLGKRNGLSVGFNYHEDTFAHDFDREIIGDTENTLAALFLKEDFRDYYDQVGGSAFANIRAGSHVNLRVEYRRDDLHSLPKNTNWAVFGDDKCFRCNPSMVGSTPFCDLHRNLVPGDCCGCNPARLDMGTLKSVHALYTLDLRNDPDYPTRGLFLRVGGEKAGGDLGGDYEFSKYWVDVRQYTKLAPRWYFDLRLMAGSAEDILPPFKEYYVGGIGTLTARGFKEFRGDRLLLGSAEYRFAFSHALEAALFVDAGDAWYDHEREHDIKTDVGFAVQDSDADFRVSYAKRAEDFSEDGIWMLRLNRTF